MQYIERSDLSDEIEESLEGVCPTLRTGGKMDHLYVKKRVGRNRGFQAVRECF